MEKKEQYAARQMWRAVKRVSFRLKAFLNLAEAVAASTPASNEKKKNSSLFQVILLRRVALKSPPASW